MQSARVHQCIPSESTDVAGSLRNILIWNIFSQSAIKALNSVATSCKLVRQYRNALNSLSGTLKVTFLRVSGPRNREGNKWANGLAGGTLLWAVI